MSPLPPPPPIDRKETIAKLYTLGDDMAPEVEREVAVLTEKLSSVQEKVSSIEEMHAEKLKCARDKLKSVQEKLSTVEKMYEEKLVSIEEISRLRLKVVNAEKRALQIEVDNLRNENINLKSQMKGAP
jgi:hypothetical protein